MGIPTSFNRMGISKGGGMPTDYIAYVSCSSYANTAETGQTLSYSNLNASNYVTYGSIPCVDMTRSTAQYIRLTEPTINQGGSLPRSYSVWLATTGANNNMRGVAIGKCANGKELCSPNNAGYTLQICAGGHSHDFQTGVYMTLGEWHHFVQNYYADGLLELWLDGVKVYSGNTFQFDINNTIFSIGSPTDTTSYYFRGYASSARLWNRALTENEILMLAQEFSPWYTITASDLSCSFYQKNETFGITYSSVLTPTFEIIEGTLPNTISFNTSNGKFTGKGPTDADHTYNLKVRITAEQSDPVTVNVTIHTYKTARISMSNQTFNFISNKAEDKSISYTSDESVTFAIDSGTLPAGMTLSNGKFYSNGLNTSAENQQVVVRATSANNQTGVIATMTLNMQMNAIICNNQTLKFYTAQGVKSKAIAYSGSLNTVSDATFAMTGTLPAGVTFDTTTGAFTSDGTQTVDETASVTVEVSSANGTSTSATATVALECHVGSPGIPEEGLVMYHPLDGSTQAITTPEIGGNFTVTGTAPTYSAQDGIDCAYFAGNGGMKQTNQGYWNVNSPTITFSIWGKCLNTTGAGALCAGKWGYWSAFDLMKGNVWMLTSSSATTIFDPTSADITKWHHVCISLDRPTKTGKLYIDGVMVGTNTSFTSTTVTDALAIGANFNTSTNIPRDGWFYGYLAAARVYNRVLTAEEIASLAAEFTPTT